MNQVWKWVTWKVETVAGEILLPARRVAHLVLLNWGDGRWTLRHAHSNEHITSGGRDECMIAARTLYKHLPAHDLAWRDINDVRWKLGAVLSVMREAEINQILEA